MNNMQQILQKAQKMQEKIAEKQREVERMEVVGKAGEVVSVMMTLKGVFKSVFVDKTVLDSLEKDEVEDLILVALNDARAKADQLFCSEMEAATGGLDMPKIPGLF